MSTEGIIQTNDKNIIYPASVSDSERTAQALRQSEGCRLTYRQCQGVNRGKEESRI